MKSYILLLFFCLSHLYSAATDNSNVTTSSCITFGMEYFFNIDGGIQLLFHREKNIALFEHKNLLLKDNSLKLRITGGITPVSTSLRIKATLQPLSIIFFSSELHSATGWSIGSSHGIGINDSNEKSSYSFSGVVIKWNFLSALQLETAALINNKWLNIQFYAEPQLEYKQFTTASWNDAWIYENDHGENMNGFNFKQFYVVAYALPFSDSLNANIGYLYKNERSISHYNNSKSSSKNGWGSDFIKHWFGPVATLKINDRWDIIVHLRWRNVRNATPSTMNEVFYKNRVYNGKQNLLYSIQMEIGRSF